MKILNTANGEEVILSGEELEAIDFIMNKCRCIKAPEASVYWSLLGALRREGIEGLNKIANTIKLGGSTWIN